MCSTHRIPLDTRHDSTRYVRYADIECTETARGFWIWKKRTYVAHHKPSGIKSSDNPPWNQSANKAVSDCTFRVLRQERIQRRKQQR